ncbi:universal stress UspA-like protein (plasmid) [Rhizobium sp. TAL182]|nr:universal stress UspA-like protein [Rhizobium sp. TAL182]
MYRTIVCGIGMDSRQTAKHLLRRAAALVDEGGTIVVMHVIENIPRHHLTDIPEEFEAAAIIDAERKLASLCKGAGHSGDDRGSHRRCRLAARVGRKGESHPGVIPDITDYVFPSIVEKVVRHAGCSVLIDRRLDHADEDSAAQTEDVASL